MKIAMVFDVLLWGGIERVGISYIDILVKEGHEVDVYILDENVESIIEEINPKCNIIIKHFNARNCPENCWHAPLHHDLKGLEVLYCAGRYYALKIACAVKKITFKNKNKQYDFAIAFSGHIKDLTFVAENYINAKQKIAWLHGTQYQYHLLSMGFPRLYRKIKNLICLSESGDIECVDYNKSNNINKKRIYNPFIFDKAVDANVVNSLKEKYGDFCLMVGRLAPDKDQKTVICALKYLKEQYGIKKNLVLVGDGNKRAEIEQFILEQGMCEQVFLMGTRSDVQNFYSAATIYVHAAPLEGLPTVFLEAMHFGLPIATTDAVPGTREILGNSEYGLISPSADGKALAANIKIIYENDAVRQQLIKKCNIRIKEFAPDFIKEELLTYMKMIQNH